MFRNSIFLFFIITYNLCWSQVNIPPNIEATGNQAYCLASQINIVTSFNIVDPDDTEIEALHIQISTGYVPSEDQLILIGNHPNIVDSWNVNEGKLSLSGVGGANVSYVNLIAAVKDVVFQSSSLNVIDDKFFSFNIGDANYLPSTNHYYEYISDVGVTWLEAKSKAELRTYFGLQGYLTTITTEDESQLVGEQSQGTGWIGASDEESEGVWKWVTGPEAGSTFWFGEENGTTFGTDLPFANWNNLNEPNNSQGGTEHYAHIVSPNLVPLGQARLGTWNDLPNEGVFGGNFFPQGYIVEYGGMAGDPIVNISASTKIFVPTVDSITGAEICNPGSLTLEASSSFGSIVWFETLTGGNQLHVGTTFSTPIINSTKTYYVLASANGCLDGERFPIEATVNISPDVRPFFTFKNCDEDGVIDGFTDFNLNEANSFITTEDLLTLDITYYFSIGEANKGGPSAINPSLFNNNTASIIYARVENINTTCFSISEINLEVSTTSFPSGYMQELQSCDDTININGIHTFNLTEASSLFIDEFPTGQNLSVHYYRSLSDALLKEDEIISQSNYENETPFSQTLYVRVESDDDGACFGIGPHLLLTIHSRPEFEVNQSSIYCVDGPPITLSTANANGLYTYEWFDENNDVVSDLPNLTLSLGGTYTVIATSSVNCESFPVIFDVVTSGIANVETDDITIVDLSSNNTITINTANIGLGNYEFSLDNEFGLFKEKPFFENVSAGIHTVFFRDKNGCGTTSLSVLVIGVSKFFTPNGDAINDTWNIKGLPTQYINNTKIFIYDRYGKLLKQINPVGLGWDGKFNGDDLAVSDYWYAVYLIDDKGHSQIHNGHFSLIR